MAWAAERKLASEVWQTSMSVRITAGVAALLLLGLGILVLSTAATAWRGSEDRIAAAERELRELLATERYFTPRLSLQTEHLSCAEESSPGAGACAPLPAPGSAAFLRTAGRVRELRAVEAISGRASHLAGQSLLLLGDPRSASAQLAEALRLEPLDEEVRADAIAAQLLIFESDGEAIWLWDALQSHADARSQRSSSPPLLFNWALLLEHSGLSAEALATWESYLMVEVDPAWRREAQARSTRLRELSSRRAWDAVRASLDAARAPAGELPSELLQHVRLLVEDRLLDRWAVLELAGEPRAEELLQTFHQIARDLAIAQSDSLLADSVGLLLMSPSRRRLAEAHHAYALGRQAHEAQDYEVAAAHFKSAEQGFSAAGSPFAIWPRIYLAIIVHHRPGFAAAERQLLELRRDPRLSRYPVAGGYIEWMLGLGAWRMADYYRAQRHFGAARDAFVGAGELEHAAAMDSQLGGVVAEISPPEAAWRHHHSALVRLPGVLKSRRRQNILASAGEFLRRQGADGAAALYLDAVVREAEASGAPLNIAHALLDRAELATSRGLLRAARVDLERALRQARAIPNLGLRSDTELDLMLAQAETLQQSQPRAALSLLSEIVSLARERRAESRLVRALAARAATWSSLGEEAGARADLRAALSEIELQRLRLKDPQARRAFVAQARDLLGRLVSSEWSQRRFGSALDAVERFRAGVLGDSLGLSSSEVAGIGTLTNEVPRGTVVLSYLVTGEETFIWRSSGRSVHGALVKVGETELQALVHSFRTELIGSGSGDEEAGKRLVKLILPAEAVPPGARRVVFVPDGPLHSLPFSALSTPRDDRLVEQVSVVVAPSLRTFLQLRPSRRQAAEGSLLVVSGIEHDPVQFPQLPRLPDHWIERRLPSFTAVRRLTGIDATPHAFMAAAEQASVVAFAGHAVPEAPGREAGLVLARGDDGDGLLSLDELRELSADRLALVILAACGTGQGRSSAFDGPRSLVEPFLAAGVGSVVGTLWEVDDRSAAKFFEAFLELYQEPDPIRAVQMRMLRQQPDDGAWAAFQHFGAGWRSSEHPASGKPNRRVRHKPQHGSNNRE